jgi:hypothetical protein
MSRKALPAVVFLAALAAAPAMAEESSRDVALEIKFGPYRPDIDSEPGLKGSPYSKVFGDSPMLLSRIEVDYEFFQRFGTLGVGLSIGYGQQVGSGLLKSGEQSTDETTFHVFPISLDLVYRFDWLARNKDVPLVPNIKGGFDCYVWWITNGTGQIPQYQDPVTGAVSRGRGAVFGGHVTFGLSLLLDFMAPDMAQTFDTDVGVNDTYLFAEFTMSWINNFKAKDGLDLSSKTFLAGIAFEF